MANTHLADVLISDVGVRAGEVIFRDGIEKKGCRQGF
jgi:hypothetical protein